MSRDNGLSELGREALHILVATVWFLVVMAAAVALHWVVVQGEKYGLLTPLLANLFGAVAYIVAVLDLIRYLIFIIRKLFGEHK